MTSRRIGLADVIKDATIWARADVYSLSRPTAVGLLATFRMFKDSEPTIARFISTHATVRPNDVAIIDDRGMVTWSELHGRIERLARIIELATTPGDRVAYLVSNSRVSIECLAASGRAGVQAMPLHWQSSPFELSRVFNAHPPALIIIEADELDRVEQAYRRLPVSPRVMVVGAAGEYEASLAGVDSKPVKRRPTSKYVIHTSGTTGIPKGVEHHVTWPDLHSRSVFLETLSISRKDRIFCAPPLVNAFGLLVLSTAIMLGSTLVLRSKFSASQFEQLIEDFDVSIVAAVSTMVAQILRTPVPSHPSKLRMMITSGSQFSPRLRDEAHKRWGQITYDGYGATEVGWISVSTPKDHEHHRGSVGQIGRHAKVTLIDDDGKPVPNGKIGVIQVETPTMFQRYTGEPKQQGPWNMRDVAVIDADGYLHLRGRVDSMVTVGGNNVYPETVNAVLAQHPNIEDCAVIGVPDDITGHALWAYVVGNVNEKEVQTWLSERVSRHKVPTRVVALPEIPRTPSGTASHSGLLHSEHPAAASPRPRLVIAD